MRWGSRVDDINAWWKRTPGERYWLDATHRNDRDKWLAAPRGTGSGWNHELITHVMDGDVVFHYDAVEEAIVACSIAHGSVEKMHLSWPHHVTIAGDAVNGQTGLSWAIGLRHSTKLDVAVSLGEIARTQWSLFPALRALEDEVGDPLYYPFEMGNQEATRLLSGSVFKLPAIFVQGFPALARATDRANQAIAAVGELSTGVAGLGAAAPVGRAMGRSDQQESHGQRRGRSFLDTERMLQGSG